MIASMPFFEDTDTQLLFFLVISGSHSGDESSASEIDESEVDQSNLLPAASSSNRNFGFNMLGIVTGFVIYITNSFAVGLVAYHTLEADAQSAVETFMTATDIATNGIFVIVLLVALVLIYHSIPSKVCHIPLLQFLSRFQKVTFDKITRCESTEKDFQIMFDFSN